ncbi:exosome complex component 10-like [Convolutriloba macropyga]|uniref:exosome complex component 10-like n=1 Tax=Convolutriloba macropyga TaxID=536237 RepID=UPI003F51DC9E
MNGSESGVTMTSAEIAHREKCEDLCKTVMESVMVVKRSVPPSDQYEYYGAFPKYQHVIRKLNDSIYKTMNTVFSHEKLSTSFHQDNQSETDFSDKFEMMVEANDVILEKVGNLMDEAMGLRSQPAIKVSSNAPAVVASWNKNQLQSSFKSTKSFSCLNWLPKPQNDFDEKPDNSTLPFTTMLVDKPNNVRALSRSYSLFVKGEYKEAKDQTENQPLLQRSYSFSKQFVEEITEHHYEAELTSFVLPDHFLEPVMCIRPVEATIENLHFIDTVPGLNAMIDVLSKEKEIAVDCEAHNHRSFLGFVCLIQISTRKHDYVVDTIALRSHIQKLNSVFTNPEILKVMHGCDSDVLWFQRDFGLYLVNVFDTGQAARALNYPTFALSYLLKRYVNFDAQKEYQMADWRQRPLPNEMLDYARMDTHALLYIADNLRNALYELQNNALFEVFNKSRLLCLKKYSKPEYHANSYQKVLRNVRKRLTNQQEFVIAKLYDWREETARRLDESPHYVLPNHMMIRIGEVLPREAQGILACCNPVPPLVREYLSVLHKIIMDAKLKHLTTDNETGLKFQSVSKNVSMTEKSFPHDISQDSAVESFNDLDAKCDDNLCAERPQVQLLTQSLYKKEKVEKSMQILSSLEHPLSKYLADLNIEPKFLTTNERSANSLSLNAKRGEKAKFPHRWRLKAQIIENPLPNNEVQSIEETAATHDVVQQKPAEIPIVFDAQDASQSILKDKSALKKEKKRKKRDVIETTSYQDVPLKKKKRSKVASISEMQSHDKAELGEQENGFEDVEDEEMEHPTLAPLKKPKKLKTKAKLSHSLMPRIRAFSNKSFSFKPK